MLTFRNGFTRQQAVNVKDVNRCIGSDDSDLLAASYTSGMVRSDVSAPSRLAWALGLSGLLPFVGLALVLAFAALPGWQAKAGLALLAYGALIASFLGGIHWGLAMQGVQPGGLRLVWGVVPSLLVWPAFFMPAGPGLMLVALVLAACYLVDRAVYRAAGLQAWLGLRATLTAVAIASCIAGAWAAG